MYPYSTASDSSKYNLAHSGVDMTDRGVLCLSQKQTTPQNKFDITTHDTQLNAAPWVTTYLHDKEKFNHVTRQYLLNGDK